MKSFFAVFVILVVLILVVAYCPAYADVGKATGEPATLSSVCTVITDFLFSDIGSSAVLTLVGAVLAYWGSKSARMKAILKNAERTFYRIEDLNKHHSIQEIAGALNLPDVTQYTDKMDLLIQRVKMDSLTLSKRERMRIKTYVGEMVVMRREFGVSK